MCAKIKSDESGGMAIYHAHVSVIKRSKGHSSVAAAAYRAGERLTDERTGDIHDYTRRRGVGAAEILAPASAPAWVQDRQELWTRVEAAERRTDSQVAREINIAIPRELPTDAGRALVRDYAKREFVDRGMVADVAFHNEGGENPHCHLLLTMRRLDADGFGQKERDWNDKKMVTGWREAWSQSANRALEEHGHDEQIDHRTLAAQSVDAAARGDHETAIRLDVPPSMHRGKTLTHRPEAAPERALRFADREAERQIAIGAAERTIALMRETAALETLAAQAQAEARSIDDEIAEIISAIPAEQRQNAAGPPAPYPLADLLDARDHRRVATIPAEQRENAAAPAAPPFALSDLMQEFKRRTRAEPDERQAAAAPEREERPTLMQEVRTVLQNLGMAWKDMREDRLRQYDLDEDAASLTDDAPPAQPEAAREQQTVAPAAEPTAPARREPRQPAPAAEPTAPARPNTPSPYMSKADELLTTTVRGEDEAAGGAEPEKPSRGIDRGGRE